MGIVEGIIYTLWRGLSIGIIISAPMGPVGILCVQRTLDKGRKTGFYTGIGAAISDLLYCLLTGFGLSFIEEFLERNSNIIQFIGSLVLIGFGIYLFKANPTRNLKKPVAQKIPAGRNILNGFLFTVSNPLIIFLIIGLFARFNFLNSDMSFYHVAIGYVAIIGGALFWWWVVTYFVDKVRAHFNLRSMWLINKIIGSIIFLFAIVGIFSAASGLAKASDREVCMNTHRGFSGFRNATDSTLVITGVGKAAPTFDMTAIPKVAEMTWEFRVEDLHPMSGRKWGVALKGYGGMTTVWFETVDNKYEESYASPRVRIEVTNGGKVVDSKTLFSGFNLYKAENAFRLVFDAGGWWLRGGDRDYRPLAEGSLSAMPDSVGFVVERGGGIRVDDMRMASAATNEVSRMNPLVDVDALEKRLRRSADPIEGIWQIYDRTLDDDYLRVGGEYRVAIAKGDGYDIIYLDGAKINSAGWQPGMRKGRLKSGAFKDVYDVEWVDSEGETQTNMKAELDGTLLRIVFTDGTGEFRLRKLPASGGASAAC